MKFEFKKEKLEPLTEEALEECGWVVQKVIFQSIKSSIFAKGNYFLGYNHTEDGKVTIRIFAKDPTLIDWMTDPENFRITLLCPSVDHFRVIESMLT